MQGIVVKKTKLILSLIGLVCSSDIFAMQKSNKAEIVKIICPDGLTLNVPLSNKLFKCAPVLKEISDTYKADSVNKTIELKEIKSSTFAFLMCAIQEFEINDKDLLSAQQANGDNFKIVKRVLEQKYLAFKKNFKRKYLEEEGFLGDALRAATYLEIMPIASYCASKISEKIHKEQAKELLPVVLHELGYGEQAPIALEMIINYASKRDESLIPQACGDNAMLLEPPVTSNQFKRFCRWDAASENSQKVAALQLVNRGIQDIPDNALSQMPMLQEINLDNNEIEYLSPTIFNGLSNLSNLQLNGNKLKYLRLKLLQNLPNLEHVGLSHNALGVLWPAVFIGLPKLASLNLGNNALVELSNNTFDSLTSLTELDLSNNNIQILDERIFNKMTNLKSLNVSGNKLRALPAASFENLTNLNILNLANNNLTSVQANPFKDIKNAQIALQGNQFDEKTQAHLHKLNEEGFTITLG